MKKIISILLLVVLMASCLPTAYAQELVNEEQMVIGTELLEELPASDELFAGYVDQAFYGKVQTFGVNGRAQLNAVEKRVYDILKQRIEYVAAHGGSTELVIDPAQIEGLQYVFPDGTNAFDKIQEQINSGKLMEALIFDCPYDLYWFDKSTGGMSMGMNASSQGSMMQVTRLSFYFVVAQNYRHSGDMFTVSTNVSKVKAAADNAKSIVKAHRSKSDYEKLLAYKDEICRRVSYNYSAAQNTSSYGYNNDPWQLIYVFDNDSSTNVVCEGYAKAFQYLCDLSDFGNVTCYTVTGALNGGGHMWNVVTMDDGKNYIADVTNSDDGTIGSGGGLFLCGADGGSLRDGYLIEGVWFQYDDDLYPDSVLKLATSDYTGGCTQHRYGAYTSDGNASCTKDGTETARCINCGKPHTRTAVGSKLNHIFTNYKSNNDATCQKDGTKTAECDRKNCKEKDTIRDTGTKKPHSFVGYTDNGNGTITGHCSMCNAPDTQPAPVGKKVTRIYGQTRYETSFKIADAVKAKLGVDKFSNIVIASGENYADALAGSYLACVKDAPILMASGRNDADLKAYIDANLAPGGQVYILGGKGAVPESLDAVLSGYNVKRLAGNTRFDTNIAILQEAGVTAGDEILVCTGFSFADSLAASAVGKPILLVDTINKKLTEGQKNYLATVNTDKFCIVGGTGAVDTTMESLIRQYGSVERVFGDNRYETSVAVAERFFDAPSRAVIAYALNYPDGLCGGPLAASMGAPLLLTLTNLQSAITEYTTANGIHSGAVLGGTALIDHLTARDIFRVPVVG